MNSNSKEKKYDVLMDILCEITLVVFKRSFNDTNQTGLRFDNIIFRTIDKTGLMMKSNRGMEFHDIFKTRLEHLIKKDNVFNDETAKNYMFILKEALAHKKLNYKPNQFECEDAIISCDYCVIDVVDTKDNESIMVCSKCAVKFAEIEELVDTFCSMISNNDTIQLKSLMSNKFTEMGIKKNDTSIKEANKSSNLDKTLVNVDHKKDCCDHKCSCDCCDHSN
jgi:hypothetical protein